MNSIALSARGRTFSKHNTWFASTTLVGIGVALLASNYLMVGTCHGAEGEAPLVAEAPIVVPDSKGGFDYLQVDEPLRRLLANHTGNNTLDVFDVDSGKLLKHVPTGKAQGVAVDA